MRLAASRWRTWEQPAPFSNVRPRATRRFRPVLEWLERRDLPATINLVPFDSGTPSISLAPAVVGQTYAQNITALNGNGQYTFSFPASVDGLTFAQSGAALTLSGTPAAASNPSSPFTFTVSVTDTANNSGSQQYTLNVASEPLKITPVELPAATAGTSYSATITASGGSRPYTFFRANLTPSNTGQFGLSYSRSGDSLVLSGTPQTPGTYPLDVVATDTFNNAVVKQYILAVNSAASGPLGLTLASSSALGLPAATLGKAYSCTLTASGGSGSYNITVPSGSLGGLTFAASGATVTLSGTPTATGSFAFQITVAEANDPTKKLTRPYTLTIDPAGITIDPPLLPPATQNVAYLPKRPDPATSYLEGKNASAPMPVQLSASGGSGAGYVFAAAGVPPGMTFSSGGVLGGTPAVAGTFKMQVSATDGAGNRGAVAFPFTVLPLAQGPPAPKNYTPDQIKQAYGINDIILSGGVLGTGAGQTIVIIEAGDDPQFVSSVPALTVPTQGTYADSDMAKFNAQFNLPQFGNQPGMPVFLKLDSKGGTNYPPNGDPGEWSQDVEWAHALAPQANIVVIETMNQQILDGIKFAMTWTSRLLPPGALAPGVTVATPTVISTSVHAFFENEPDAKRSEFESDSIFRTPDGHAGVTVVASAGDEAIFGGFDTPQALFGGVEYPATSPNVLAAGEAMLLTDLAGNYIGELAVAGSGAGISSFEPQPSFQSTAAKPYSSTNRTTPDVAIIGAAASGVSVYNSVPSTGPWLAGIGTSLSAPIWAALIAIVNQGRVAAGLPTVASYTQEPNDGRPHLLPMLYALPASDFHAIAHLDNGVGLPPGYNLHTGLGSPVANRLVAGLVGGHDTISGTVSNAADGSGLPGWLVFLDANASGSPQPGEATTTTDAGGNYSFLVAPGSNYRVRVQPPAGWRQTSANPAPIHFTPGQDLTNSGVNFRFARPLTRRLLATGAGAGGGPEVRVFDAATRAPLFDIMAYAAGFTGGVRVAVADVTGDGIEDVITAAGPGGGPDVHLYDGSTGSLIRQFFAFSAAFTGGVFVAGGDVNGDSFADIVCGADAGGGPNVIVFSGKDGSVLRNFFAFDANFTGGVRVGAGDVNGDGQADLVCGAGPGGGPNITVVSGADSSLLASFFAFSAQFTGGVYVSAGDLNGDGRADVIAGAGAGGGPNVAAFDGRDLALLLSFFAYDSGFLGGVRVGAVDANGDGTADILTGAGPGGGPQVALFNGVSGAVLDQFFAFDTAFTGGVFVS